MSWFVHSELMGSGRRRVWFSLRYSADVYLERLGKPWKLWVATYSGFESALEHSCSPYLLSDSRISISLLSCLQHDCRLQPAACMSHSRSNSNFFFLPVTSLLLNSVVYTRSRSCEKRLLASSCLSVRVKWLGIHWRDFTKNQLTKFVFG
jgi:hypothetical protein